MPCKSCYFLHINFVFIKFHCPSGFTNFKLIYFLKNILSHPFKLNCGIMVNENFYVKQHVDVHNAYRGGGQTKEKGIEKTFDTSVYHGGY